MTQGRLTTPLGTRRFILAGNATVTLVSEKTGKRFTYKITCPKKETEAGGLSANYKSPIRFVSFLTGPDNEHDFRYLGYLKEGQFIYGGVKARANEEAAVTRAWIYAWEHLTEYDMPEGVEIWHEGSCGRCGRKLTVPESIESGFGPECITEVITG